MASTEAQRSRLRIVSRSEVGAQASAALIRPLNHPLVRVVVAEAVAVAVLLSAVTAVFWPMVLGTGVYAESDTFTFFFPVFAVLHAAVRSGELPLWTPDVFGGFPLFAEGQIGALYPPALVAARLASTVEGFLLVRVFHIAVATLGAYFLARALGNGRCGAVVGGLAFGLGSFVIAQQHHANLLAAAVWLPLLLALVELALSRQGWIGHGLLGLAALVLGMAALATHVQPLMLTGALLTAYVLVRQAWAAVCEVRTLGLRRGIRPALLLLLDALATVVFVGAVGALIAAAQILPLYELSQESWRAHGWSYTDAIEYSLPPINLLTLVFPFFFRSPDGGQWSLWQVWESVLYVGIAPLLLAVIAAISVRRWFVTFFALSAVTSTLVALGGYAPFGLYQVLWQIPGMNVQRAPARFSLIAALSLAMLAAAGADWLARHRAGSPNWASHRRRLLLAEMGGLLLLAVLVCHLVLWHAWVQSDRTWAMQVLGRTYLAQSQDPLQKLLPLDAVQGLESSLSLGNPKTAASLGLLAVFILLVIAWRELPRGAHIWQGALVALVAADLCVFASDFHPLVDVGYLTDPGPAGQMLVTEAGPWRVLTSPDVQAPQPNELLPYGLAEASGYSPLQLDRHRWYQQSVFTTDNSLLDLWSVRWLVESTRQESRPSYQQVSFHPGRPLLSGGTGTPNGEITLSPEPAAATELRMIAGLSGAAAIRDGEMVGEWLLTDTAGVRYVLPVRAGREIADWQPRRDGATAAHPPIQTAVTIGERGAAATLGYAELPLPRRVKIATLRYRHVHPMGRTELYGVAFYDREDDVVSQVTREDRYRIAYTDPAVTIYENPAAYPRAFVVPEAVVVPDGVAAISRLRDGPLDPQRQVVLERTPTMGLGPFTGTPAAAATIAAEGSAVLDVQASAPGGGFLVLTDPYYPGWRAYVDGEETPILRADYLFRAIELPPGSHQVRFVFTPWSLARGTTLSLAGIGVALAAMLVGTLGPYVVHTGRRQWFRLRRGRPAAGQPARPGADGPDADASGSERESNR
ncbi:MAG: YfhO family protein [Chloroflexota bacterium]